MEKIVICGDGGVGKTCFLEKLITNNFTKKYNPTLGFEVHQYNNYSIWDISGQEKYQISDDVFNGTNKVYIFYDGTSKISFKNIPFWENKLSPEKEIFYVRTKCDIEKQIPFYKENEFRISSKNGIVHII